MNVIRKSTFVVLLISVNLIYVTSKRHYGNKPLRHKHSPTNREAADDSSEEPDNEVPVEATSLRPNYFQDIFLDNEDGEPPLVPGNPLVDFIVVKHRFSNETNLAFPPYSFVSKSKRRSVKLGTVKRGRSGSRGSV